MKNLSIKELERKRNQLLKQLKSIRPFICSTLSEIRTKCGKPNCHCVFGEKHVSFILTRHKNGKTKTTYVPVELTNKVKEWVEESKRIKLLMKEITEVGEQIIKQYIKEKGYPKTKNKRGKYESKKTD